MSSIFQVVCTTVVGFVYCWAYFKSVNLSKYALHIVKGISSQCFTNRQACFKVGLLQW